MDTGAREVYKFRLNGTIFGGFHYSAELYFATTTSTVSDRNVQFALRLIEDRSMSATLDLTDGRRLRSRCLLRTFTQYGNKSRRYLRTGKGSKRFFGRCATLKILTFRQILYDVVCSSVFTDSDSLHTSRANVLGKPGPGRRCSGGRADKRNAAFGKTKRERPTATNETTGAKCVQNNPVGKGKTFGVRRGKRRVEMRSRRLRRRRGTGL